jgi:hypothetical protein
MNTTFINILVWLGALVLSALLFYNGTQLPEGFFKYVPTVGGVLVLAVTAFERFAWRWPGFNALAGSRPDLHGTWKGVLKSEWKDKDGNLKPPIEVYFVIRQTFLTLHIKLLTPESFSDTVATHLSIENGTRSVVAVYRNEPELSRQPVSPIHYGSFRVTVVGTPAFRLRGEYWTARSTKGEFEFSARSKVLYDDFQSASAGEYVVPVAAPAATQGASAQG